MRSPLARALEVVPARTLLALLGLLALGATAASAQSADRPREGPLVRPIELTGVEAVPGLEPRCASPAECVGSSQLPDARLALVPAADGVSKDAARTSPGARGIRQGAGSFGRLELYAANRHFGIGPAAIIYDMEGGATLRLLRSLSLTAGYRVLGFDENGGTAQLQSGTGGPRFGVAFDF